MKKPITVEQAESIPIAELLAQAHPSIEAGRLAPFRLELPCGCVRTYHLSSSGEDNVGCTNRTRTYSELN